MPGERTGDSGPAAASEPEPVEPAKGAGRLEYPEVAQPPFVLAAREPNHLHVAREVAAATRQIGFAVTVVDVEDDVTRIGDAIAVERPALVFNLVEEFEGDNTRHAAVAAYLDLLGIPHTGSDALCLGTCQDRARTRLILADAGIPVPRFETIRDINVIPDTAGFRFPVIVTQAYDDLYEDEGIERPVRDHPDLVARTAELFKEFELPFLVEEYIECRRLHAVVLGNRVLEVLPLVELQEDATLQEPRGDEGESDDGHEVAWRLAQLDYATADRIRELARRAFRVTGCRDAAQIDFHLDYEGKPHVVDVRPIFELGPESPFRSACEHTERGFAGVIAEIAKLTCQRAAIAEPVRVPEPEIAVPAPQPDQPEIGPGEPEPEALPEAPPEALSEAVEPPPAAELELPPAPEASPPAAEPAPCSEG